MTKSKSVKLSIRKGEKRPTKKGAGLSAKGIRKYNKATGSKLKTAVTEKSPTGKRASRRKSFCARMKGMKKKRTSSKTAKNPNSRINQSLKRWRC